MKNLLKTILAVVLSMVAGEAFAHDFEVDGIYYSKCIYYSKVYLSDSTVRLTYRGGSYEEYRDRYRGHIVIPDSVTYEGKTYAVIEIDNHAFEGCQDLVSVVLPQTIKAVGDKAFKDCSGLTVISIPEDVSIEEYAFQGCTKLFDKCYQSIVKIPRMVVDTLKAEQMFNEMYKPTLLAEYEKGVAKQRKVEEIQHLQQKKVKSPEDLELLNQAYMKYLSKTYEDLGYKEVKVKKIKGREISNYYWKSINPESTFIHISRQRSDGHWFNSDSKVDKNVEKGILTPEVRQYLSAYHGCLSDSLRTEHDKIERGWAEWIAKDKLPLKEITVSVQNSLCRGSKYYLENIGSYEEHKQHKGWEALYTEESEYRHDSYPVEVYYYVYPSYPDYRVIRKSNEIAAVYDKEGKLVYIPSLKRNQKDELISIKRLVYLKDYVNNKYGIQSQSEQTKAYIIYQLTQELGEDTDGEDFLASMLAAALVGNAIDELTMSQMMSPTDGYKAKKEMREGVMKDMKAKQAKRPSYDRTGNNYIEQLEKDHADEFGYVYMIDRLSNVSFQVVFLHKLTMEPTYCAVITYKTGSKPYTTTFSAKLINMPDGIPPVLR